MSVPDGVSTREHLLALLHEQDRRVTAVLAEMDLRNQQRYDSQTKAVDSAFIAQQTAMQAALAAADRAVTTAMLAAEKAVSKAEAAAEKRFDSVNEFRAAYQDIIGAQMPRAEAEQRLSALSEKIDDLKSVTATAGGRTAGAGALWGYLAGAVGVMVALVSLFMR